MNKFIHQVFIEHSPVPGAARALQMLMPQWMRLEALDPGREVGKGPAPVIVLVMLLLLPFPTLIFLL